MHRPTDHSEADTTCCRRLLCRLFAVALIALSLCPAARAEEDPAITEFIARLNQSVRTLGSAQGYERAQAICLSLIRSALNMDTLASAVSAGSWSRMTAQQRASFRTIVEGRVSRDCARNRGNRGESLTFIGVRRGNAGDRLIATRWGTADAGRTVIWRVRSGSDQRLRAVDMLLEGRSLTIALADEVRGVLERTNGSIDALLNSM